MGGHWAMANARGESHGGMPSARTFIVPYVLF